MILNETTMKLSDNVNSIDDIQIADDNMFRCMNCGCEMNHDGDFCSDGCATEWYNS